MPTTATRLFHILPTPTFTRSQVTLASGLTLDYVEQGDAAGVPVVLLHGVTDSWRSFEPMLAYLPPSVRAIAITQRGHGDSDKPDAGYRAADYADDVAQVLDALGIRSAFIVGHSMGATNAARFALDYPLRTRGLGLLGAIASFRQSPDVQTFYDESVSRLIDPVPTPVARDFQLSTLAQAISPDFLDTVIGETLKVPARVWRASFAAFLDDECAREWEAIAAPALVLWGAKDAYSQLEQQYALVESMPDTRFVVYERAGHALHWEEPMRAAADIAGFVTGFGAGTQPVPADPAWR